MKLVLPTAKANNIVFKSWRALSSSMLTNQTLSELVGTLVSVGSATHYGLLYTRSFEIDETRALRNNIGNYVSIVQVSPDSRLDLTWWISRIGYQWQYLQRPQPIFCFTTDASLTRWGATTLKSFVLQNNVHITVKVDSSTAMAYINIFGGCRSTKWFKIAKPI